MRKNEIVSLLVLTSTLLISCTTHIVMNDIRSIGKDMTRNELGSLLRKSPSSAFQIVCETEEYWIDIYKMKTGTVIYTQPVYSGNDVIAIYYYNSPITEDYFFIFRDNGLIYWGFIHELHKSDNASILNLATMISNHLDK
jgi:predicted small secreted protein